MQYAVRYYECECQICKKQDQQRFFAEPYPEHDKLFECFCKSCQANTPHRRVLTRKLRAELRRIQAEKDLRQSIVDNCAEYGFSCRFLYQSVIVTTPVADWCFDYHQPKITLYHESTIKINFETGNYCKAHCQFRDKKMKPNEVIDYIASHDSWRAEIDNQTKKNRK